MSATEEKAATPYIDTDHQLAAPPKKRSRGWIVWVVLLALLAVALYLFLHRREAKAPAPPVPHVTVTTATAVKGDLGIYLDAIGTVTPVYTASITAQASGLVIAVNYHEGQFVHKGDSLIEIDPRSYQAQLLQAQGALERDKNILAQAQMDLDRYSAAWAKDAIPKQTLDDQEKIVLEDQGTVKNDQGTVDYDQVELSYCHITAPIDGKVGLRLVDPGNVVQAGSTTVLAVITQIQPITVIFTLAEDSLAQVQARMRTAHTLPVEAMDRAQSKKLATGKLFTIDNQIDTTTGTVKLRAQFDNKDGALFPNQFVNTRLLVNTLAGATLVPTGAVQMNGQASFVYVIAGGVATQRAVKTGIADKGMTSVQGINPGDAVATSSFDKLQSGSKVVVSTSAPPGTSRESTAP